MYGRVFQSPHPPEDLSDVLLPLLLSSSRCGFKVLPESFVAGHNVCLDVWVSFLWACFYIDPVLLATYRSVLKYTDSLMSLLRSIG